MERHSAIYIAGHRGLVGSAIYRRLRVNSYMNQIIRTHSELDLERQADVEAFFDAVRPEYVFLAAAKVGGIWANLTRPAEFIYRNLAMQINLMHASWKVGVKRLLFLGSSCIYPRECPQPMREEYLLTGPLEPTNQPYAMAKLAGIIQCETYNRQYATRFLAVMPTNLYGPNDNFDLETCHVIPALVRKFHLAKLAAQGDWEGIMRDQDRFGMIPRDFRGCLALISDSHGHGVPGSLFPGPFVRDPKNANPGITLWGSGSPRREFLHVDDLADACLFLMVQEDRTFETVCFGGPVGDARPFKNRSVPQSSVDGEQYHLPFINIGCGKDVTVRELAAIVKRVVGYEGEIFWDTEKPDGTPRKLLETSRLKALGWSPRIDFEDGIQMVYSWYQEQLGCTSKPNLDS